MCREAAASLREIDVRLRKHIGRPIRKKAAKHDMRILVGVHACSWRVLSDASIGEWALESEPHAATNLQPPGPDGDLLPRGDWKLN
jgi:hypothetical protein